jgi:hypothetical protein
MPEVFIAHGREKEPALELALLLLERMRINPKLLELEPHEGKTIIEKLLKQNASVTFAFIILTPDDTGALKGETPRDRARQNVIFEAGQFIGALGRENVCFLVKRDVELPSDLAGEGYHKFNNSVTECWLHIERELERAGLLPKPSVPKIARADSKRVELIEPKKAREISKKIHENKEVSKFWENTSESLNRIFLIRDNVFLDLARSRLTEFRLQLVTELGRGIISFPAEAWRTPYLEILSQPDVTDYKSVAFVKSEDYWQESAGKYVMEFNFEFVKRGKRIERIFILRDAVWGSRKVKYWIKEQREEGIRIAVVRERCIPPEEDLLYDLGIYGDRAVSYHDTDDSCRTISFQLDFNRDSVERAKGLFRKLKMYTNGFDVDSWLET